MKRFVERKFQTFFSVKETPLLLLWCKLMPTFFERKKKSKGKKTLWTRLKTNLLQLNAERKILLKKVISRFGGKRDFLGGKSGHVRA